MDELLQEFLTESMENIAQIDVELVTLEQDPNNKELLSSIFRLVHTIKGTCGFIGLSRLEAVAHAGENVLGKIRDGALMATPEAISLILECIDGIKRLLGDLEAKGEEIPGNDQDLISRLNALIEAPQGAVISSPSDKKSSDLTPPLQTNSIGSSLKEEKNSPSAHEDEQELLKKMSKPEPNESAQAPEVSSKEGGGSVSNQTIRVNVDVIENLMNTVSELVLTRNQLLQMLNSHQDSEFTVPFQRLNHVTSELQEAVMKTRMQPIGSAWAKFPRVIRDLSHELNKKITLEMKGAETELDRQVLELMKDPLTHMVRNCADHGIEPPHERIKAGKAETGTVLLNAFHEGGHINIQIIDDGRGIEPQKIKKKAISLGLVSESDAEGLSDTQILSYIFKPGFSTAAQVTNISGRGVGMDVVKSNIDKIGGTVDLTSTPGRGSKFSIKIPLTLAIISALIVEVASEKFAIPQIAVLELVWAANNSEHVIEYIHHAPFLRLRNHLLPLVSLSHLLKLREDSHEAIMQDAYIIVTQVGNNTFGIIVDHVFDTQEIVVKPVAPILRDIPIFSGNTILGDGSVVMILDPNGIASIIGETKTAENLLEGATPRKKESQLGGEKTSLLLFKSDGNTQKVVPLALISRLEECDGKDIEYANGCAVIQYRDFLMPLMSLSGHHHFDPNGQYPVLVFSHNNEYLGLVVEEIVDIVDDVMDLKMKSTQGGSYGSCVINHITTDIIDVDYFIRQVYPNWFENTPSELKKETPHILLVDDSSFFNNLITPLLRTSGYHVVSVNSPLKALDLCDHGEDFDLIISDIEMPEMDGFEFTAHVRQNTRWKDIPIIALTSHATPEDFDRGRAVGFTDYLAKQDRDHIISSIENILSLHRSVAA